MGWSTGARLDALLDAFLANAGPANAGPANGQRIVARAWIDPDVRQRLLADGNAAVAELGYRAAGLQDQQLEVVANTDRVHNVVVCTRCSCYPLGLLGPSPSCEAGAARRGPRQSQLPKPVSAKWPPVSMPCSFAGRNSHV